MASRVDKEILGLEIAVDIAELVECIHTAEHLSNVEARVPVVEDSGIVQQSTEITSWDVFLSVLAHAPPMVVDRLTMAR